MSLGLSPPPPSDALILFRLLMNLQTKIIIYTVAVMAVTIGIFTGISLYLDFHTSQLQMKGETADLALGIAPTVDDDLERGRFSELRRTVQSFSYLGSVSRIEILDENNEIPGNLNPEATGERIYPPVDSEYIRGAYTWHDGNAAYALAPIRDADGNQIGSVFVANSISEDRDILGDKLASIVLFGGLFGIFGCYLGLIAGQRLAQPLQSLIHASEDLAVGRHPGKLHIRTRDEVGQLANSFNRMVDKRREAEAELERSRQHLLFLLRETPLGYVEFDADFKITNWNKAAENIFGFSITEAIGKDASTLIVPPELREEVGGIFRKLLNRTGGEESLNQNLRADGSRIICHWNNTYISDMDDNVIAVASLVSDVTENMRNQERMRSAMEAAQQATRAKSEFLANMSHEIRTPMNGVIGLTELLLESDMDPQQRSYLEVIRSSGEMLLTIINDILDLSKIESGKLTLSERVFDLEECLCTAFHLFQHTLKRKGIEHHFLHNEPLPRAVCGDPVRLRQVVYNLISNAVKFTENGSITISTRTENLSSRRVRLYVSVKDSGSGIEAQAMDSVFEPFHQGDTSSTRSVGGTGLGLTICRRLCRLMRGDIQIDFSSSGGTQITFHVELQSANPEVSKPSATPESSCPSLPTENLNILLVEDNAVNRLVAASILKHMGYECVLAEHGKEAIEALRRQPFDVILMDLQMPVMDGFEATHRIREEFGNAHWIIALTASAVEGDHQKCLDAGMDDYLSKPVSMNGLRRALAHQGITTPTRS